MTHLVAEWQMFHWKFYQLSHQCSDSISAFGVSDSELFHVFRCWWELCPLLHFLTTLDTVLIVCLPCLLFGMLFSAIEISFSVNDLIELSLIFAIFSSVHASEKVHQSALSNFHNDWTSSSLDCLAVIITSTQVVMNWPAYSRARYEWCVAQTEISGRQTASILVKVGRISCV